ncbi:hypothetical protein GQ42DRAFT_161906, partial [Ramicandelaber brevisporus]
MGYRRGYKRLYNCEHELAKEYHILLELLLHDRSGTIEEYAGKLEEQLKVVQKRLVALATFKIGDEAIYKKHLHPTIKTHRLFSHLPMLIRRYGSSLFMSAEIYEAGNPQARNIRDRYHNPSGDIHALLKLARIFLYQVPAAVSAAETRNGAPPPSNVTAVNARPSYEMLQAQLDAKEAQIERLQRLLAEAGIATEEVI